MAQMDAKSIEPGVTMGCRNLIININHLQFPKQGLYFVEIWLDAGLLTTLHLYTRLSNGRPTQPESRGGWLSRIASAIFAGFLRK